MAEGPIVPDEGSNPTSQYAGSRFLVTHLHDIALAQSSGPRWSSFQMSQLQRKPALVRLSQRSCSFRVYSRYLLVFCGVLSCIYDSACHVMGTEAILTQQLLPSNVLRTCRAMHWRGSIYSHKTSWVLGTGKEDDDFRYSCILYQKNGYEDPYQQKTNLNNFQGRVKSGTTLWHRSAERHRSSAICVSASQRHCIFTPSSTSTNGTCIQATCIFGGEAASNREG